MWKSTGHRTSVRSLITWVQSPWKRLLRPVKRGTPWGDLLAGCIASTIKWRANDEASVSPTVLPGGTAEPGVTMPRGVADRDRGSQWTIAQANASRMVTRESWKCRSGRDADCVVGACQTAVPGGETPCSLAARKAKQAIAQDTWWCQPRNRRPSKWSRPNSFFRSW
jgi:hypothetical protein